MICWPSTGVLPPTRTYHRRSWVWLTNGSGEVDHPLTGEILPGLGKLTIKLQHSRNGVRRNVEIDTYAVDEVEPQYPGCRAFVLLNLSDPQQREPYLVHVGGVDTCRCRAGLCRVDNCKHRDACEALIEEGLI